MQKYTPKVSIIIPVYNVEKYIRKCLDSVVNQTLKDIEIICIDDGSTDSSNTILKEYAERDNRIIIFKQKNKGVSAARNSGFRMAKGEYIGIVDSDDYVSLNYFEELYNSAIVNSSDIAATNNILMNQCGIISIKACGINTNDTELISINEKSNIIVSTGICWNKIYKRSFINKYHLNFLEIKTPAEDNYFTDLAIICANKVSINNNSTYYYQIRNNSESQKLKSKSDFKIFKIYREIEKKIRELKISENEKQLWFKTINERKKRDFCTYLETMPPELTDKFIKKAKSVLQTENKNKLFAIYKNNTHNVINLLGLKIKIKRKGLVQQDLEKQKPIEYDLYSFDIFDTLVTRPTATPVGIFSIIQNQMIINDKFSDYPLILRKNFFTIRRETEAFARANFKHNYNSSEIMLDDIYKIIQNNYSLSNEQKDRLQEYEVQTENNNLLPIEKNIARVKELIEANKKVVLISDMYLSSNILRKILTNIDPIFANIKIYVSGEIKLNKSSGELYKYVREQENVEYWNWMHVGDNKKADIKQAKKFGIKAVQFKYPKLMDYEKKALLSHFLAEENLDFQLSIGLSKLNRLQSQDKSKVYNFGCSYAGPILYGYVNWILEQAERRNISTLHFIARDGYILKLIADEIIKIKNLDIKTKYIYGSRKAWRIPNESNIDEYLQCMFDEYHNSFSISFISERLDLPINEIKKYLTKHYNNEKILDEQEINKVTEELIQNDEFKKFVIKQNKPKLLLLEKYIKQTVDFENKCIAFVDLHGTGRTSDLLADIITKISGKSITTFYITSAREMSAKNNSNKVCYLATIQYRHFSIELLCRTTDGQTIGYKEDNSEIIPILESFNPQKLEAWGINNYIDGIISYTRNISTFEARNNTVINLLTLYKNYITYLKNNLNKNTADIIGSIPYITVGKETDMEECAKQFHKNEFIKMLLFGNKAVIRNGLAFISLKRSSQKYKNLYDFNKKHENLRNILKPKGSK